MRPDTSLLICIAGHVAQKSSGGTETVTSSIVILVVMLFFTFALAGMDWVLNNVMSRYVLS